MKNHVIFGLASLALLFSFWFGSAYYKAKKAESMSFLAQENAQLFIREHSQSLGSDEARVHLVEFMDPACETCAAFSPLVKEIMEANPGKIRLVLRYAPFHEGADTFVKILEASKKQGKYWETLNVMYRTQPFWASHHDPQPDRIWQFLPKAGVNVEQIRKDMEDPEIVRILEQDMADAGVLEVRKTPGFFVNGKPLQVFGHQQLVDLIEAEIKLQYGE